MASRPNIGGRDRPLCLHVSAETDELAARPGHSVDMWLRPPELRYVVLAPAVLAVVKSIFLQPTRETAGTR
jgi:hypothetical protein